jgi:hypothetical protein
LEHKFVGFDVQLESRIRHQLCQSRGPDPFFFFFLFSFFWCESQSFGVTFRAIGSGTFGSLLCFSMTIEGTQGNEKKRKKERKCLFFLNK